MPLHKQEMQNAQHVLEIKTEDVTQLVGEIDDERLEEEMKRASTLLWTLRLRIGDIVFSSLPWRYWMRTLRARN